MSAGALHVAEPPARYQARPPLVVDCSVVAAMLFGESRAGEAEALLAARELHAPFLLQAEFASVAVRKAAAGAAGRVADALAGLGELRMELYRIDASEVTALARRHHVTAYDACYLWLADVLKSPLATFDDRLAGAASAHFAALP
jgi:predicted nucleic acid-binding protein